MEILLSSLLAPVSSMKVLCMAFLGILFAQSGFDKIFNYMGNKEWLTGHFAKSPLKGTVGIMLPVITALEIAAGLLCIVGLAVYFVNETSQIGMIGAQVSAVAIVALFFGQRMAQDYEGAATLTSYFLMALASIYVLGL